MKKLILLLFTAASLVLAPAPISADETAAPATAQTIGKKHHRHHKHRRHGHHRHHHHRKAS